MLERRCTVYMCLLRELWADTHPFQSGRVTVLEVVVANSRTVTLGLAMCLEKRLPGGRQGHTVAAADVISYRLKVSGMATCNLVGHLSGALISQKFPCLM